MAEPPSSDRRRPPPVPPSRRPGTPPPPPVPGVARRAGPSAPLAASASAVPVEEEGAEPTRPISVPDRARVIEELSEQIAREAEALLTSKSSADADDALADINLRLALFAWDVLE